MKKMILALLVIGSVLLYIKQQKIRIYQNGTLVKEIQHMDSNDQSLNINDCEISYHWNLISIEGEVIKKNGSKLTFKNNFVSNIELGEPFGVSGSFD